MASRITANKFLVPDNIGMKFAQFIRELQHLLLSYFRSHPGRQSPPHLNAAIAGIGEHLTAFYEMGLLRDWQPDIRILGAETGKYIWSNADDSRQLFVQVNRLAHDGWVRTETTLPEAVI